MKTPKSLGFFGLSLAGTLSVAPSASAAERHFGYSYESAVLSPGLTELQPWTTVRAGRADYYNSLDARLGFQLGLSRNLEGALFWNFSSVTEDIRVPGATLRSRLSSTDFQSLTAQLKYELTDPVADALGTGLLLDGTVGPSAVGVEGRLLLDKQFGSLLLAANLVGGGVEKLELKSLSLATFGATLSAGYFVTPNFVTSLEARSESIFSGRIQHSVVYLGPSLSLVSSHYWLTLAVQPQIAAFKGASPGHRLDLDQNEFLQTRLLLGFAL
jgi:hypothetical protein